MKDLSSATVILGGLLFVCWLISWLGQIIFVTFVNLNVENFLGKFLSRVAQVDTFTFFFFFFYS